MQSFTFTSSWVLSSELSSESGSFVLTGSDWWRSSMKVGKEAMIHDQTWEEVRWFGVEHIDSFVNIIICLIHFAKIPRSLIISSLWLLFCKTSRWWLVMPRWRHHDVKKWHVQILIFLCLSLLVSKKNYMHDDLAFDIGSCYQRQNSDFAITIYSM